MQKQWERPLEAEWLLWSSRLAELLLENSQRAPEEVFQWVILLGSQVQLQKLGQGLAGVWGGVGPVVGPGVEPGVDRAMGPKMGARLVLVLTKHPQKDFLLKLLNGRHCSFSASK